MRSIAPMFVNWESLRKHYDLTLGWRERVRHVQPASIQLDDAALDLVEGQVRWYVDTIHINSFNADRKAVLRCLKVIRRCASNVLKSPSPNRCLELKGHLTWPKNIASATNRAKYSCWELLALHLCGGSDETPFWVQKDNALCPPSADSGTFGKADLEQLLQVISNIEVFVKNTNAENEARLAPIMARMIVDGEPRTFKPDPLNEHYFRPEGNAQHELALWLCQFYKKHGGTPFVPSDGDGPTLFVKFLDAVVASMPNEVRRPSLHSPARQAWREFKKLNRQSDTDVGDNV
jgi:hypothetical protein